MNRLNLDRYDSYVRIGQHDEENPLNPPVPRATELLTELRTVATGMAAESGLQDTGLTGLRGGTDERQQAFAELLAEMKVMNIIARGLDRAAFPGIMEQFRMPRSRSFGNIVARGQAFVANATGKEAIFTDRGLATGFLTAFTAKVTAAEAAAENRNVGLLNRAGATAAATAKGRRGLAIVRELDAIMTVALRNSPGLLASWRAAKRVTRRNRDAEETPAGSGTGTTPPPTEGSGS